MASKKSSVKLPDEPLVVSFSGGRTSALMLHKLLEAGLRERLWRSWEAGVVTGHDAHVLFANTGKERLETLDFVHEIEECWQVPITWLEYVPGDAERRARYKIVAYETASRAGEPFDALVAHRKRLPNPLMRMCRERMKDLGFAHWVMSVGIRADEPKRVARMKGLNEQAKERWTSWMPLAEDGTTEADVLRFWRGQPFDLQLRTWEGNCDLCFLKAQDKRVRIMQDRPDLAAWWLEKEAAYQPFRANGRSFADLADKARRLPLVQFDAPDASIDDISDCSCTD